MDKANPASRQPTGAGAKHALIVFAGFVLLYTLFFAPVLFSGRLLAPGDGIIYFLPNFASHRVFWDPSIWGGFPAVGDSQLMLWYPPAIFFSLFGAAGHQPFLLTGFALASSFTYGYTFSLTRSHLAAIVGGCVYGLSAFMMAHLGHAALIHAAAWLPLVIWSLAELQRPPCRRFWLVVAVVAIACAALAGHPQIFVYTLALGGVFVTVTGARAPIGPLRYYSTCAVVMVLGTGLAAIQFVPTAELTRLSWRAALGFDEFTAYGLTLRQIPVLLFPFLYGGSPGSFYAIPYFGAWPSSADGWGAGELSGYVGLLPLLLALAGFVAYRRTMSARFWLGVAAIAFLLSLGAGTPLAHLTYYLPIVNKFRAPARHFLELTFAVSVLSGLGLQAIQQPAIKIRLVRIIAGAGVVLVAVLVSILLLRAKINELALQRLGHPISLKPWTNPALFVPFLIFVAASLALLWWQRQPKARARVFVLLLVLIADLASFGWFCEWRYRAPYKAYLRAPAAADSYRAELKRTGQRLLPVRGGTGRVSELPPNLSKLWDIGSASGYGPFILTRTSELLTMPPHGSVDASWRDGANQDLDLMAVRFLVVPAAEIEPPPVKDERGWNWAGSDLNVQLGPGCNQKIPADYKLDLPAPQMATRIGIVSSLACSVALNDGENFATLKLTDVNGETVTLPLNAGRDSSEWAYDCADVRPEMKQSRAQVFRSYPVERGSVKCEGHEYLTLLQLSNPTQLKTLEFHSTSAAATFALKKITLIDDVTRSSTPVNPVAGSLNDGLRWRRIGEINADNSGYGAEVKAEDIGTGVVFENLRARPRVWLVSEVLSMSATEAFTAARSSRLPDGRTFDPARTALVEEPIEYKPAELNKNASAVITHLTAGEMEVRVTANVPSFLITSDVYYPGWQVTIDGAPAQLYRADYALRGVSVAAGTHLVRFEFRPSSFYYGAGLSVLSLLLLIAGAWYAPKFSGTARR